MPLRNRVALVTGGSRGIGRELRCVWLRKGAADCVCLPREQGRRRRRRCGACRRWERIVWRWKQISRNRGGQNNW